MNQPRWSRSRRGGRDAGRRTAWLLAAVSLAAGALAACGGGDPPTIVDGDLAFVGVNVLPMDRDRVIENQTVVIAGGTAWVQVGAGLVADSDPAAEFQETEDKACTGYMRSSPEHR